MCNEPTKRGVAVALVAMSKSLAAINPNYRRHLMQALLSAEEVGLDPKDLELLRLLLRSSSTKTKTAAKASSERR